MMILPEGVVLTQASDMEAMKGKGAVPPPHNSGRMFNRPTDIAVHPRTGECTAARLCSWGGSYSAAVSHSAV
jgi:hypothetical protein